MPAAEPPSPTPGDIDFEAVISGDVPVPLPSQAVSSSATDDTLPHPRIVRFARRDDPTLQDPEHILKAKLRERASQALHPGMTFTAADLPSLPGYDSISAACRFVRPDADRSARDRILDFIWAAAVNASDVAQRWWVIYADLTTHERARVSFDDVAVAAGIQPARLVAIIVETAMTTGRDAADLVAAVTHPEIVAQTVKSAKRIGGDYADIAHKDRMTLLQNRGFAAVPRGMSVHVHANANASAQAAAASASRSDIPSFMDDVKSVGPAREHARKHLLLPQSTSSPDLDPIDALTLDVERVLAVPAPVPAAPVLAQPAQER